jgi:C_GCAxxG_C_C family probable redox protein
MMKTKTEIAAKKMTEGFNCAQAIFFAHCDDFQFEKDLALKIASGFGAGMGRKEEVCGAVSGGIMVLGFKYGSAEKKNRSAKEKAYRKTRELMDHFQKRHGTYICRDLLKGCDLMTKQGQRDFKKDDLLNRTCKPCVESVVEILDKIM